MHPRNRFASSCCDTDRDTYYSDTDKDTYYSDTDSCADIYCPNYRCPNPRTNNGTNNGTNNSAYEIGGGI